MRQELENVSNLFRTVRMPGGTTMHTPFELVEEMLDHLPKEIWNDPTKTFLDPACGRGTFLLALYYRLFDGLVEQIPDEDSRRQHILKSMLWGVDIDKNAIRMASIGFKRYIRDVPNLVCADSLEYDFMGMKFDVVIGNPPFNSNDTQRNYTNHRGQGKNMSKLFTLKALDLARDFVLFVQPYGQRTYSPVLAQKYLTKGLIKIIKCSGHFSEISQRLGYFIFDIKNPKNKVQDAFESELEIPEKNISILFRNQPGKLSRFEYEKDLKDAGIVKVIVTTSIIKYTDDPQFHLKMGDTSFGHWRVVFNCTTSLTTIGKVIIAAPEDVLSKSVHCLVVSSEEEAKKYAAYLKEKTTEKVLASVKVGMCNSKKFIQYIPLLD